MRKTNGTPVVAWLWAFFGPVLFQIGLVAYGLATIRWIQSQAAPGAAAALLALPPILAEAAFTWNFELRSRRRSRRVITAAIARLLFAAFIGYLFVILPLQLKGSWNNWFVQDLAESPKFLRIVWFYSPVAAGLLLAVCAAAYVRWTVRRRQARWTTTMLLPGIATLILFILLYYFPWASVRGGGGVRPSFVTRVWTPHSSDHRIPREVMVTPDERFAVATFGSTFPLDGSDPPPNDLKLNPTRCDPPNVRECRRNLTLIDLQNGTSRSWAMPITRRFQSEAPDRVFVVPYRIHELIELQLDGTVKKFPLPERIDNQPFDEVNHTYYAADIGRVFIANGNNPVIVAWDIQQQRVDKILQLAGWNGLALGDVPLSIARSRSRHRIYVSVKADHPQIVEIDESTLKPLRSFQPLGYDIELSPDEKSIYVASFLTGEIWRFNADSLQLEATLAAPIQCRRIAFSPDGEQLFAASYVTGELAVYATRSGKRVDSFYVARRLEGMHVAGSGLYLLSAEGLYRIPLAVLRQRGGL